MKKIKRPTFEEMYDSYKKLIYYETFKHLKSLELIEESMQETMIKILKQYEKLADMDEAARRVYIGKIARGTATDFYYKEVATRNNVVYIEELSEGEGSISETEVFMSDIILDSNLEDSLDELTSGEREIIHLFYFEEIPYSEIASLLGISEDNARQRMCRAKKYLKKILESKK